MAGFMLERGAQRRHDQRGANSGGVAPPGGVRRRIAGEQRLAELVVGGGAPSHSSGLAAVGPDASLPETSSSSTSASHHTPSRSPTPTIQRTSTTAPGSHGAPQSAATARDQRHPSFIVGPLATTTRAAAGSRVDDTRPTRPGVLDAPLQPEGRACRRQRLAKCDVVSNRSAPRLVEQLHRPAILRQVAASASIARESRPPRRPAIWPMRRCARPCRGACHRPPPPPARAADGPVTIASCCAMADDARASSAEQPARRRRLRRASPSMGPGPNMA